MIYNASRCITHDTTRMLVEEVSACQLPVAVIATLLCIGPALVGLCTHALLTHAPHAISDTMTAGTDTRSAKRHIQSW